MIDLGTVRGEEINPNRDGETDVRLLQVELTNADDLQTIEYMGPAGDDSNPVPGTRVLVTDLGPSYRVAVAFSDGILPISAPGEKRLYSCEESHGVLVIRALIYLKANGDISIENSDGEITIDSNGVIVATNGTATLTISDTGDVTLENSTSSLTMNEASGLVNINGGNLTIEL